MAACGCEVHAAEAQGILRGLGGFPGFFCLLSEVSCRNLAHGGVTALSHNLPPPPAAPDGFSTLEIIHNGDIIVCINGERHPKSFGIYFYTGSFREKILLSVGFYTFTTFLSLKGL